jgi:N-acetylated-alpha-linked acidic dipeptidase
LIALEARIDSGLAERRWHASTADLKAALARFAAVARVFAAARDSALAHDLAPARAARVNHWLMQVERRFTRPQGLATRSWYRSLEFASDLDNGYSTMVFPSVNEAIRYGTATTVERELADLTAHVDAARDAIAQATAALR